MLHMIWLKNNLKKYITSNIKKADSQKNCQLSFLFIITLLLSLLFSCKNTEPVVIWTDCPEFAAYAEIYNARNETKVLAKADHQTAAEDLQVNVNAQSILRQR